MSSKRKTTGKQAAKPSRRWHPDELARQYVIRKIRQELEQHANALALTLQELSELRARVTVLERRDMLKP